MFRTSLAVLLGAGLVACASAPTTFQAAANAKAVGYSDYRIEPGRYRVTFQGGSGAPSEQVTDFALLRAADVVLADGYDWFRVVDRRIEERADSGPRLGLGVGGANFGRHTGVGVNLGTSVPLGGGPRLTATIEVVGGRGAKPSDTDAYDARSLKSSLNR